jgi:hypothetical protein
MTFGFGLSAGFGLTSISSVSSAIAGAQLNSDSAIPEIIPVDLLVRIFMIVSSKSLADSELSAPL